MDETAAYIRVSSEKQADEDAYGPGLQRNAIQAYAARQGLTIHEWFEDHASGLTLERPDMERLRAAIRARRFSRLIVFKLDRIARGEGQTIVRAECALYGVEVHASHDHVDNGEYSGVITAITAMASKKEWKDIKERTHNGRLARARSGKLLPGPRPTYGYFWSDGDKSRLEINPETAIVVKRIFSDYVGGKSQRAICLGLMAEGIPTATGKAIWDVSAIRNILIHPFYCGRAVASVWRPKTSETRNAVLDFSEAIELPEGTVPPIVSVEVWNAAQERLKAGKRHSPRNHRNPDQFLLRNGFAICGHCGRLMRSRTIDDQKRGYSTTQYFCHGQKAFAGTCDGRPAVSGKLLDGFVWQKVSAVVRDPAVIVQELERQRGEDPTTGELATTERLIADTSRKINNVSRRVADIDDDDIAGPLMAELRSLVERKRWLESERDRLLARQQQWRSAADTLDALNVKVAAMQNALDALDNDTKRQLLTALNVRVKVFKAGIEPRIVVEAAIPLGDASSDERFMSRTACSSGRTRTP